jgi:hypothetical protein
MAPWLASRVAPTVLLAAGLLLCAQPASATAACAPAAEAGVERCVSGLRAADLAEIFEAQQASNWCWAASVAMILRSYGARVSQEEVVRTLLGVPQNQRASAQAVGDVLNRTWRDAFGQTLVTSAQALAPWRRAMGVSAPEVLDDLANGRPVLLGA